MRARAYFSIAAVCAACASAGKAPADGGAAGKRSESDATVAQDATIPAAAIAQDATIPAADDATIGPEAGQLCTYVPGAEPAPDCPDDVPSSCMETAPSYQSAVSAVVATYCGACHRRGGLAPDKPFDTYATVYKTRVTMLNRLTRCVMPPACAPQPNSSERSVLLQWLVCGAPNN